jgi:hypothetical protein
MSTHLNRKALEEAADHGLLYYGQIKPLIEFLEQRQHRLHDDSRFNATTVLLYLGGMLAIGACTVFSNLALEKWGMRVLFAMSSVYLIAALVCAFYLEQRAQKIPASIFATLSIALIPLVVFAAQQSLGFWPDAGLHNHYNDYHYWIDWRWIVMEVATLLGAILMLRYFKYSFLVLPIAVTLFYMSMDLVPSLLLGTNTAFFSEAGMKIREMVSMFFGIVMCLVAFFVNQKNRHHPSNEDFAFWLYVFGVICFWGGLSMMDSGSLFGKFIYLGINIAMILCAAILQRRVFAVFGAIGMCMVLVDFAQRVFKDSLVFVLVLSLAGFALMYAGVWWNKNQDRIVRWMQHYFPASLNKQY